MSKAARKPAGGSPAFGVREAKPRPFIGVLFLILSILTLIAIGDYRPEQHPAFASPVTEQNLIGSFGVLLGYWSFWFFGQVSWLLWLFVLWMAYLYLLPFRQRLNPSRLASIGLCILSLSVLSTLIEAQVLGDSGPELPPREIFSSNQYPNGVGGFVGDYLYRYALHRPIGMGGTLVVFTSLFLFSLAHLLWDNAFSHLRRLALAGQERWTAWQEARAKARQSAPTPKPVSPKARTREEAVKSSGRGLLRRGGGAEGEIEGAGAEAGPKPMIEEVEPPPEGGLEGLVTIADMPKPPATPEEIPANPIIPGKGLKIVQGEQVRKAAQPVPHREGDFLFPPISLLREAPPVSLEDSAEVHQATAEVLVRTLGEFGVKVTIGEVHTGPVITRYDVYPAAGVRVEKIVNLDRNLALALKALSVRILAPVPGRGCVGIEVPNKQAQAVFLRDIIESEDWVGFKGEIPIALGKEVSGRPLIADLTKMPHLLIAGSTGSGKTVCINTIITSLVYRHSPEDLRFVMVDPKIVEMQMYNALPHMLIPVVTDPKKVPGALKYLLNEMERRYQMFASVGVRNIAGFNLRMAKKKDAEAEEKARAADAALSPEERAAMSSISVPRDSEVDLPEKIPYVVFIIDELADLMMVAPADIETGVARLAQLARAAGIHLIIATQRPSVNVITGIIKANLPSRIAFKVAAKVDSRTILDTMGADQLIGRGDMLFLPPGTSDLVRSQGAWVSDEEINAIVEFMKQNGEPVFDEIFQRSVEESAEDTEDIPEDGDGADDDLIRQSIEVLRSTRRASTSMLQRRLRIGYNRAARIMEELEERGIVGPDNGSQPREILKDLDNF